MLAQSLQLPVILHVRKSYDEIAAMVRRLGFKQGGVVHAFSGSEQQGLALIKLGFLLGIGGAISHSRAIKLRKTVTQLPLESLVLETDSPDMKPAFLNGPRNSPVSILLLAQIVASLKQCSLDEVILSSNNNLLTLMPNLKELF
jgi:TatD DNase family protein